MVPNFLTRIFQSPDPASLAREERDTVDSTLSGRARRVRPGKKEPRVVHSTMGPSKQGGFYINIGKKVISISLGWFAVFKGSN